MLMTSCVTPNIRVTCHAILKLFSVMAEGGELAKTDTSSTEAFPNCLPLSSPALNNLIDFILSGSLTGCKCVRNGCDMKEYLYNYTAESEDVNSCVYYTGSRAEGIDRASDDDIMFVHQRIRVLTRNSEPEYKNTNNIVYFTAVQVRPGYVHLSCTSDIGSLGYSYSYFKFNETGGFLRNDAVKGFMTKSDSDDEGGSFDDLAEHGPALTDEEQDVDFVCAFPSDDWPELADEFITRPRLYNQPSKDTIDQLTFQGCLFVGVGHHNSTDRGKEWRLSFSLAEKVLVRSWDDVRVECYVAAKALCKETLPSQPKIICSYFIKTAIFWLSEKLPDRFWNKSRLLECISAIIKELWIYTVEGVCSNYFLPSNNMLDHTTEDDRKSVSLKLESILEDLPLALLQTKLNDETFKSAKSIVKLYLVLKNSDSPAGAEQLLTETTSHVKTAHCQDNDKYYESMHLSEIALEGKGFFHRRLLRGAEKIDCLALKVLQGLPTAITDSSFRVAYEKLLFLAIGCVYQGMAITPSVNSAETDELLAEAEIWISKVANLDLPCGFNDKGVLSTAYMSLLYYSSGNKEKACHLAASTCEDIYSDLNFLHDICRWSCAVAIETFEADTFVNVDSKLSSALRLRHLNLSPISVLLYVAIQSSEDQSQKVKLLERLKNLGQWLPPQITYFEKQLHANHAMLVSFISSP